MHAGHGVVVLPHVSSCDERLSRITGREQNSHSMVSRISSGGVCGGCGSCVGESGGGAWRRQIAVWIILLRFGMVALQSAQRYVCSGVSDVCDAFCCAILIAGVGGMRGVPVGGVEGGAVDDGGWKMAELYYR